MWHPRAVSKHATSKKKTKKKRDIRIAHHVAGAEHERNALRETIFDFLEDVGDSLRNPRGEFGARTGDKVFIALMVPIISVALLISGSPHQMVAGTALLLSAVCLATVITSLRMRRVLTHELVMGDDGFKLTRGRESRFFAFSEIADHWWERETFFITKQTDEKAREVIQTWKGACSREGYRRNHVPAIRPGQHEAVDTSARFRPRDVARFREDLKSALSTYRARTPREVPSALSRQAGEPTDEWISRITSSVDSYRSAPRVDMEELACDPTVAPIDRVTAAASLSTAPDEVRARVRVAVNASADERLVDAIEEALCGEISEDVLEELIA